MLVAKGNEDKIQGFKDLDGRKLAVQIGTTAAAKAKDIKDAKVQTFNNAAMPSSSSPTAAARPSSTTSP